VSEREREKRERERERARGEEGRKKEGFILFIIPV
jgi:hypothetical protein